MKWFKFKESIGEMNIQAKKLVFIEELLRIDDEGFILRLESLIKDEKTKLREKELKPIPLDEFHEILTRQSKIAMPGA